MGLRDSSVHSCQCHSLMLLLRTLYFVFFPVFLCFIKYRHMSHAASSEILSSCQTQFRPGNVRVNQTTAAYAANNPQLFLNLIKYILQSLESRQLKEIAQVWQTRRKRGGRRHRTGAQIICYLAIALFVHKHFALVKHFTRSAAAAAAAHCTVSFVSRCDDPIKAPLP